MTLSQAFDQKAGTSIPSPDNLPQDAGQCVSWADYVLNNVYGFPYVYANAIDWWKNPQLAPDFNFIPFAPGVYPQAGDFVVWGSGVGSQYGHIDLCAIDGDESGFTGYDSNWGDLPTLREIQHNYAFGILGYIRLGDVVNQEQYDQLLTILGLPSGTDFAGMSAAIQDRAEYKVLYGTLQTAAGATPVTAPAITDWVTWKADGIRLQAELDAMAKPTQLSDGTYKVGA